MNYLYLIIFICCIFFFSFIDCYIPPTKVRRYDDNILYSFYCDKVEEYTAALAICRSTNGFLAHIKDASQMNFIKEGTNGCFSANYFWLGLTNEEGLWKWSDNSLLSNGESSPYWSIEEPNLAKKCVMIKNSEKWYTSPCGTQRHFICQNNASDTQANRPLSTIFIIISIITIIMGLLFLLYCMDCKKIKEVSEDQEAREYSKTDKNTGIEGLRPSIEINPKKKKSKKRSHSKKRSKSSRKSKASKVKY